MCTQAHPSLTFRYLTTNTTSSPWSRLISCRNALSTALRTGLPGTGVRLESETTARISSPAPEFKAPAKNVNTHRPRDANKVREKERLFILFTFRFSCLMPLITRGPDGLQTSTAFSAQSLDFSRLVWQPCKASFSDRKHSCVQSAATASITPNNISVGLAKSSNAKTVKNMKTAVRA